ncbi:MAG: glycosyltransferase family 2 protein [Muribaculaceae bacterium]|nr:glycosyltransferase family 2 protein [Muribaculaceae bacterium]
MSKRPVHPARICVVIPTYDNAGTVVDVIERTRPHIKDIIVVDDGSTDSTAALLRQAGDITVVTHERNRGKGRALLSGFAKARELGFDCVITIDADGQHYPEDLPLFIEAAQKMPGTIIVGSRGFGHKNMAAKSKFANKFSNFWFALQTGIRLPDTQTGYRLYPLDELHGLGLITSRYESELELMVYAAWHAVPVRPIDVRVHYPKPEERVSHFRPGLDFTRISLLNTGLTLAALVYGYPCKLICSLARRRRERQ